MPANPWITLLWVPSPSQPAARCPSPSQAVEKPPWESVVREKRLDMSIALASDRCSRCRVKACAATRICAHGSAPGNAGCGHRRTRDGPNSSSHLGGLTGALHIRRITEYPQLEGIHNVHRIQLLILHRTPRSIPPSGISFDFTTFL